MTDLSTTVAPKSDQLNADDLLASPRTIKVTKVTANPSSAEQPIAVYFEGDNGKPYLPCKSMRRVLINVWGKDGSQYTGRSMTLYRDPEVMFGGLKVGGIRISHVTNIDAPVTMALTATRASRKPFTVKPLPVNGATTSINIQKLLLEYGNCVAADVLDAFEKQRADIWKQVTDDQRKQLKAASDAAKRRLAEMDTDNEAASDAMDRDEQL